jgi:YHS domain-containing protein
MKYLTRHHVFAWGLLWAVLFGCPLAYAAKDDPLKQLIKTDTAAKGLKFSALFKGRGDGVTTCPVTGEKITKQSLKAEYYGRTVHFCCHGCLKAAKQNPEKFVKPTVAEQQQAVKAYIAKANQAAQGSSGEEYCND